MTHMIAACATDIMLSDGRFCVKIGHADAIVRVFPGMPDVVANDYRCTMSWRRRPSGQGLGGPSARQWVPADGPGRVR